MKNKFFDLCIFTGLAVFIGMMIAIITNVVPFGTLWVSYVVLFSLLLIFGGISFRFKKYTDYDETLSCLKRARRSIAKIKPDKEVGYMKTLSIVNQLANAQIYLEDIASRYELYDLTSALNDLKVVRARFKMEDSNKVQFTTNELLAEITPLLDFLITTVKQLKK